MKKKALIFAACVVAVLALSIGIYWYFYPTCYPFNDRFIIGATEEAIVEKYGNFSTIDYYTDGEIYCGVYKVRDNTPELIMGYDNSLWYEIYFENGIAVRVRLQEGQYGG